MKQCTCIRLAKEAIKVKKQAFNPYLPSWEYIPEGEPYVFGDRVYVYGSHDMAMFIMKMAHVWAKRKVMSPSLTRGF